jgi:LAS superfamily LD-carboxypeptidase LdcB
LKKNSKNTIIAIVIIAFALMVIAVYLARAESKSFRDAMDKIIPTPLNPFAMANIVLNAAQEEYISNLHPQQQWRFRAFIKDCEDEGWSIIPTSGYRDFANQKKQWIAGFNNAQKLEYKSSGKITGKSKNAIPGKSHHNYGLALDINAIKGTTKLMKGSSEIEWTQSGIPEIAKRHGLSWQYQFKKYKDPVHFFFKVDTSVLLSRGIQMFGAVERIIGTQIPLA